MNKKEFSMFAMALKTFYPREGLLPNEQAMRLWFNQLQDIPYKTAEMALNKWVATNKWSPSIAEIRQTASEVTNGDSDTWGEAWEQVLKAVSKYGLYREIEALGSMPPLTQRAVRSVGYRTICLSENIANERANFRMIYEELATKEQKNAVLSDALKKAITESQGKLLEGKDGDNLNNALDSDRS